MVKNNDILNFCNELNERVDSFTEVNYLVNDIKLSDTTYHKFEETFSVNDWDILTDTGFKSIKGVSKTIPYEVWEINTAFHSLRCADTHIVFDDCFDEVYVKDLNTDSRFDKIQTENGPEMVSSVINTKIKENMYDIQLDDNSNNRYYTNGILSHNSIFLANDAVNFVRKGHNTAFISAEMGAHKVVKRIGANALNIQMSEYAKKAKDKNFIKRRLDTMSDGLLPSGKLFIKHVPTSQFSVLDIESYLKELEEVKGIKIEVVIIDYINILANYRNPNSDNTYMKIKQIAEDLRAMAIRNDWLIITATQINRDGYDSTEITMNNIAESAGLSHTADMMYAIIQDKIMYESDPPEYWIKVLKIRDGEGKNMRFKLTIDYEHMRLTETLDEWNGNQGTNDSDGSNQN
jgi:archaellum biogenesis ATPase FlaH